MIFMIFMIFRASIGWFSGFFLLWLLWTTTLKHHKYPRLVSCTICVSVSPACPADHWYDNLQSFLGESQFETRVMILLMAEILHLLRLVVYPIIFRVLYIPGGCLGFLNHQQYHQPTRYMTLIIGRKSFDLHLSMIPPKKCIFLV